MVTNKWVIDPTHSEINFKVKHLMISSVAGNFSNFAGSATTTGDNFTTAAIGFSADVNSISTNNEQRDAHLKNGDFFDAETYPHLTFTGSNLVKIDDDTYSLPGVLSIRGIDREIILDVEFGGITTDPWGGTRAGFSLKGKISRSDFGISFGMVSETGGILLADEVKLSAEVQFVKQEVAVTVEELV